MQNGRRAKARLSRSSRHSNPKRKSPRVSFPLCRSLAGWFFHSYSSVPFFPIGFLFPHFLLFDRPRCPRRTRVSAVTLWANWSSRNASSVAKRRSVSAWYELIRTRYVKDTARDTARSWESLEQIFTRMTIRSTVTSCLRIQWTFFTRTINNFEKRITTFSSQRTIFLFFDLWFEAIFDQWKQCTIWKIKNLTSSQYLRPKVDTLR